MVESCLGVALLFAGEDRAYVEECANILTALGIRAFYDSYEHCKVLGKVLMRCCNKREA